jgi:hypothetical protein
MESMQLTISENDIYGNSQGFSLNGITFEALQLPGIYNIPVKNRVGAK